MGKQTQTTDIPKWSAPNWNRILTPSHVAGRRRAIGQGLVRELAFTKRKKAYVC